MTAQDAVQPVRRASTRSNQGDRHIAGSIAFSLYLPNSTVAVRHKALLTRQAQGAHRLSASDAAQAGMKLATWSQEIEGAPDRLAALRRVQRLVHAHISYIAEDKASARSDDWQTPMETLSRGAGDCEDHALLKRELLLRAGIAADAMELVILRTASGDPHAALSVTLDDESQFVLDNRAGASLRTGLFKGDVVVGRISETGFHVMVGRQMTKRHQTDL